MFFCGIIQNMEHEYGHSLALELSETSLKKLATSSLLEILTDEVGLELTDIGTATNASFESVSAWLYQDARPNKDQYDRLDALRALTCYVLRIDDLEQPKGTGQWLRAKRFSNKAQTETTSSLQQIAEGNLEQALTDADAMFTGPAD